jgi:sorbitol-specific phosphotransferase system component IIBC
VAWDSSSLLVAPLDSRLSIEFASFCAATWLTAVLGVLAVIVGVVGVTVGVEADELGEVGGGVVEGTGWVEGGGVALFCFG